MNKLIFISVSISFLLAAIVSHGQQAVNSSAQSDSIEFQFLQKDNSDFNLVFVHGWCIDMSYWKVQADYFSKKHSVMTLDLPDFGKSKSTSVSNHSIEYYADFLNEFLHRFNLEKIILIGHSFAADIVIEAAIKNENVIAIVGVDSFKEVNIEMTDELQGELTNFYAMLESDFKMVSQAYADQALFCEQTTEIVKTRVKNDFIKCNAELAIKALKSTYAYAMLEKEKLQKLKSKLYLINSSNTPTNTDYLSQQNIPHKAFYIDNVGHYPMIENAKEFNKHLKAIIDDIQKNN